MNDVDHKPVIVSGSTHPVAARKIAEILECDLVELKAGAFHNGERHIEILRTVRGKDVFLIQTSLTGKVDENLMETSFICDALRRAGAHSINLVQFLFPYERQDRREIDKQRNRPKRKAISSAVVAGFYEDLCRVDSMITIHLHTEQIEGFFKSIPVENITIATLFTKYLQEIGALHDQTVFAGPDVGSVKMVADISEMLDCDYVIIDKRRDGSETKVMKVIGDVKDRIVVIYDDQIDTAGTIIGAAEKLIEMGAVEVYVIATHFVGSNGAVQKLLDSKIKKIIVTDTVPTPELAKYPERFTVLSVVPIIAKVITNIFNSESLQEAVAHKVGKLHAKDLFSEKGV